VKERFAEPTNTMQPRLFSVFGENYEENAKLSQSPMWQARHSEEMLQVELIEWLDTSEITMDRACHGQCHRTLW
jgi:hypothetical protein